MWIAPLMIVPGGNPVTAVPGVSATSPLMMLGPVLVMVLPARIATLSAPPKGIMSAGAAGDEIGLCLRGASAPARAWFTTASWREIASPNQVPPGNPRTALWALSEKLLVKMPAPELLTTFAPGMVTSSAAPNEIISAVADQEVASSPKRMKAIVLRSAAQFSIRSVEQIACDRCRGKTQRGDYLDGIWEQPLCRYP